jgi:glycosyltransferase involved in cell wall biosynthesis
MSRPLLHVVRSLDPATGGPSEVVRQLCTVHEAIGVHTEVATFDRPDAPWLGNWPVPTHAFRGCAGYGWAPKFAMWLRSHADRYSGVFVHGLWQWQGAGTRKALRGSPTPYFVFPHGMLDRWFRQAFPWRHARKACYWKLLENRVVRDADCLVFTSEEERQHSHETFFPWAVRRETVLPLGCAPPPQSTEEMRSIFLARFPLLRGKRILLFLGRLHEK